MQHTGQNGYQTIIRDLLQKRATIDTALQALQTFVNGDAAPLFVEPEVGREKSPTIREQLREIMRNESPKRVYEITQLLAQRAHVDVRDKNAMRSLYNNAYSALRRNQHADFARKDDLWEVRR